MIHFRSQPEENYKMSNYEGGGGEFVPMEGKNVDFGELSNYGLSNKAFT